MTANNEWFERGFAASPYMGILRAIPLKRTVELSHKAWDAGIELIEIPVQSLDDLDRLRHLAVAAEERGKAVGAGTIRGIDQVDAVKSAGARFIVSPGFDELVVQRAHDVGLDALPGVGSASEVDRALRLGLTWLKAFPAAALGSIWISQMAGPFPEANFVATGGMSLENAEEFLAAGARGIAIGSAIEHLARS